MSHPLLHPTPTSSPSRAGEQRARSHALFQSRVIPGARSLAAICLFLWPVSAQALELSLPIDCTLGKSCFIQNAVDIDPGPGVRDFMCGAATYDGHKGTDFRLVSIADAKRDVAVLAAAPGIVKGLRDDMLDVLYDKSRAIAVAGRECGNGLVLDHGDGWETQYCHLKRGSLAVRGGQRVERGARLGAVGYSGRAAFAHVHLSVRHKGKVVDPFLGVVAGGGAATSCSRSGIPVTSLWQPGLRDALQLRTGQIIETGFSGVLLKGLKTEEGLSGVAPPDRKSPVLLYVARVINLEAGDRLRLAIDGPAGFRVTNTTPPFTRTKATFWTFIGKKRNAADWPPGQYIGTIEVLRKDAPVSAAKSVMEIK